MARRRYTGALHEAVGAAGLFGIAYGYLGAIVFWGLGLVALWALDAGPFVILLAVVVLAITAAVYVEATAALPKAGGVAGLATRGLNDLLGFAGGWTITLDLIIVTAAAAFSLPFYLSVFWPRLAHAPYNVLVAVGVLVVILILNVMGVSRLIRSTFLVAVFSVLTQGLLLILGLVLLLKPRFLLAEIDLGIAPSWGQLAYALPLAVALFVGIDAVSSMADEVAEPGNDAPQASKLSVPLAAVLFVGLAFVAVSAQPMRAVEVPVDPDTGLTVPVPVSRVGESRVFVLADRPRTTVCVDVQRVDGRWVIPAQEVTGPVFERDGQPVTRLWGTPLGTVYRDDPVQAVVKGLPASVSRLERGLRPWVAALGALALLFSANMSFGGAARVVHSLARNRQLPALFGRVYAARMTPYVAMILVGIVATVLVAPADSALLAELLGFGSLLAFALAHVAVIALRYREPGLARPYYVGGNVRIRGASVPVVAVCGAVLCAALWVALVATHPTGRLVGAAWLAFGLVSYVMYRKAAGHGLLRPPRVTHLPASAAVDIDYNQILVPVIGSRLTDEMMVLGCQLATEKAASIDALYVVEVPMELSLDAPEERQLKRAEKVLELAGAIATEFGVEMRSHVVVGRSAGRAIVDVAEERRADVVILGAVRKRRLTNLVFGDTVSYVLRHAACEVLVNLVPADYPMAGSADEAEELLAAQDDADGGSLASQGR